MKVSYPIIHSALFAVSIQLLWGQTMPLQKVGSLHEDIEECSGIALIPSGHIAMINDSGNRPDLFFSDSIGQIVKRRCMAEVSNIDWEDITYADGYLYIGDFGNNKNKRQNLVIYKYSVNAADSVNYYSEIHFRYADQHEFAPNDEKMNYDLEAMVVYNDSIFVFTKNRTKPFTGYTYQYGMPVRAGHYNLTRLDSFKTGTEGKWDYWWISSAALSPDKSTLVLLGYDKMWAFKDFRGSKFLRGKSTTYQFNALSQKEGITFLSNDKFMITDERNRYGGGDVYTGTLSQKTQKVELAMLQDADLPGLTLLTKEFTDSIAVNFSKPYVGKILWEIFATNGNRIAAGNKTMEESQTTLVIDASEIKAGGYVLNVILNNTPHAFKLKKLYTPPQKE